MMTWDDVWRCTMLESDALAMFLPWIRSASAFRTYTPTIPQWRDWNENLTNLVENIIYAHVIDVNCFYDDKGEREFQRSMQQLYFEHFWRNDSVMTHEEKADQRPIHKLMMNQHSWASAQFSVDLEVKVDLFPFLSHIVSSRFRIDKLRSSSNFRVSVIVIMSLSLRRSLS